MMCGNNVMDAGYQQERLDAKWIVGFVDGEGCFHIALNRQPAMRVGWQVLPEFRVVQHNRNEQVLRQIQSFFGFGSVTVKNGDRKEFRVRGLENLTRVVEFFEIHSLCTTKKNDFLLFAKVIRMMQKGNHLTKTGLVDIARISLAMNSRQNTSASRILRDCTLDTNQGGKDTVRPSRRREEATRNRDPPSRNQRSKKQQM